MGSPRSRAALRTVSRHRYFPLGNSPQTEGFCSESCQQTRTLEEKSISISEVVPASDKCPTTTALGSTSAGRQGRRKSSLLILQKFLVQVATDTLLPCSGLLWQETGNFYTTGQSGGRKNFLLSQHHSHVSVKGEHRLHQQRGRSCRDFICY